MPSRLHKNRKLRGHVSAGHGRVGKHRKHPGGRGNAGAEHHHRINVLKYHPGYIGKKGMRNFHENKNAAYERTLNVFDIWGKLPEADREAILATDKIPLVDLEKIGFTKVLGSGPAPPRPMRVSARYFSKHAREKIEAAGGECIATGPAKRVPVRHRPKE